MVFHKGQLKRQGPGLSVAYFAPTTSLVASPLACIEAPFIFEQVASDFQTVTVQGQALLPDHTAGIAARLSFALTREGSQFDRPRSP